MTLAPPDDLLGERLRGFGVVAHAAFNLTAIAMIYWNLESTVAHFLFD